MTYQILVYCDGRVLRDSAEPTGSHADRRAMVARLEFIAAGESHMWDGSGLVQSYDQWVPHPTSRRRYRKMRAAGEEWAEATVCEFVSETGEPFDIEARAVSGEHIPNSHMKFLMRCGLCGLDYQFRAETLAPYLDTLRRADWDSVSLSALGAILQK